jgi:hypothetical protein
MTMLQTDKFAEAARAFTIRHADFDPQRQMEKMVQRAAELLEKPAARGRHTLAS